MRSKPMPPVPPAGRSPKGPGSASKPEVDTAADPGPAENTDDRADHGNIKQETRNKGFQQDR